MAEAPLHHLGVRRGDWMPNYNVRRVDDRHLLTNRAGRWDILTEDEFNDLNGIFCTPALIERLAARNLLLTETNGTSIFQEWRRFHGGGPSAGPQLHVVHLTQRCNLGCTYCHSSAIPLNAEGRDLATETALQVANFIASLPANEHAVSFQGGEPTLMHELIDMFCSRIVNQAPGKRIRFSITSNGTNFSDSVVAVLRKHGVRVSVSLDGDAASHDRHRVQRTGDGSHALARQGIEVIRQEKSPLYSGAILVLTRQTIGRIRAVIDEYVAVGQFSVHLKPATKLGSAKGQWDEIGVEFEEFWSAYTDAIGYMFELGEQGKPIVESNLLMLLEKVFEGKNPGHVDARNPCGLVYGVLNYDIDGQIYGCHEGKRQREFLLGTVKDDAISILSSRRAQAMASLSVLDQHSTCRGCAYLPYCSPCPAGNYQTYKSSEVRPLEDFHCRLMLAMGDYVFKLLSERPEPLMKMWKRAKTRNFDTTL
jgi:uncharacterized protein